MRVLRGFLDIDPGLAEAAVTIGNFDGVHRGHQSVILAAVNDARTHGGGSVACTFDPHTRAFLTPESPPRLLETLEQRLAAIGELGVDVTVVIPFTAEVAGLPREEFVEAFLRRTLRARALHLSDGFTFGVGGAGNVEFLRHVADASGFSVHVVPPVIVGAAPVSSTRVRDAVVGGRVEEAHELLGRPFTVVGRVVRGAGRGKSIGVPTANIEPENACVPAAGVYVTEARTGAGWLPGVTNVGVRPTFGATDALTIETHLFDHHDDLYGAELELAFLRRLREERSFAGVDELTDQIEADLGEAREFFAARAEELRYTADVSEEARAGQSPPRGRP